MAGVEQIEISKPVDLKAIESRLKELEIMNKKQKKASERLEFIRLRYLGYSTPEACTIRNVSIQTGYNWQKAWNESGMDSVMPNYGGGRPPSMTAEQKERFKNAVAKDMLTTVEAGAYLRGRFGLVFTPKHVRSMLRSMGFRHAKPYDIDYRRPADAETDLKKTSDQRWTL
ncbi:MAG: helix-turn-helix domain-containing protein [Methanomassiliicoccaceae archaeon]|nr:helix-turn-helix domain-containing protein [Methanomassiliicoccaceae archaeon]